MDGTNNKIKTTIESSGVGTINYRGHGTENGWIDWNNLRESFTTNDALLLNNGKKLPVVFSIACENSMLDSPNPCLAEAFTKSSNGAVAFLGATRVTNDQTNNDFDTEIYYYIKNTSGRRRISQINNVARHSLLSNDYYSDPYNYNLKKASAKDGLAYLWLGDPSLDLYTDTISQIPGINITDVNGTVTVTTGVKCDICISGGNNGTEVYSFASGSMINSVTNMTIRPLYISISAHNYITYNAVTSGTISTDETWFYNLHILGDIVVQSGKTLTIKPGTTLTFENGASLIVNGTLNANGSSSNRIKFDFIQKDPSTQNGIKFYYTGSSGNIAYTDIKNAYNAVYCHNSSPTLLNNSFYDSNIGLDCQYNSSPTLAGYYLNGNNVITRNDRGINSDYNSNPFIGGTYGGYNSIYGNITYNIAASYGCSIYAMNDWWGNANPDPNKIYQYQSTINYSSPLPSDPNSGRSLSKISFAGSSGSDDELMNSIYLQLQGKYGEAITSYGKILDKEIKSSKGSYALAKLSECYEKAGKKDFIDYLNNSISPKLSKDDNLSIAVLELENYWFMKQAKYNEVIMNTVKIKNDYKERKDTYKYALFNEGYTYYVYLKNIKKAKESFAELVEKYPEDPLVIESRLLFGMNFVDGLSPKAISMDNSQKNQANTKIPENYTLLGNYPNPFNPSTKISYAIPQQSFIEIKIYNIMGNEVRSFTINSQNAGYHNLQWDGKNSNNEQVTSGIYIYRLKAVSYEDGKVFEKSAKMMLLK